MSEHAGETGITQTVVGANEFNVIVGMGAVTAEIRFSPTPDEVRYHN